MYLNDFVFGKDAVELLVMWGKGDGGDFLKGKKITKGSAVFFMFEKIIVVSSAASEAHAVTVKSEAGNEDEIDLFGVEFFANGRIGFRNAKAACVELIERLDLVGFDLMRASDGRKGNSTSGFPCGLDKRCSIRFCGK